MKKETKEDKYDEWGYRIPGKQATSEKNENDLTDSEKESESVRLLRRIEENTSATHFWTRVTGIPVLIVGFLMAMAECN